MIKLKEDGYLGERRYNCPHCHRPNWQYFGEKVEFTCLYCQRVMIPNAALLRMDVNLRKSYHFRGKEGEREAEKVYTCSRSPH